MENARFGVSTSKVSSSSRLRTRILMVPSVTRICETLSERFKKEKPVLPDRRIAAEPMCSSARAPLSVQSLSPVLIGCGALRDKESHRQREAQQAHQFQCVCSHIGISPET